MNESMTVAVILALMAGCWAMGFGLGMWAGLKAAIWTLNRNLDKMGLDLDEKIDAFSHVLGKDWQK